MILQGMKLLVLSFIALVLVTNGDDNANAESVIPTKTEYERYLDQILLVSLSKLTKLT